MVEKVGRQSPEGSISDEITEAFLRATKSCPEFTEAVDIIKRNSNGSIWLIGGFVYRNIIKELYGVPVTSDVDFDFIVETPSREFVLPSGWEVAKNSFGNPKFKGPKYEIDFIPLDNIYSIRRRGLTPTIENFLSGVPLTVQAVVYNVTTGQVVGETGIAAVRARTVGINNEFEAQHIAGLKEKSIQKLVQDLADSLQFQAVL